MSEIRHKRLKIVVLTVILVLTALSFYIYKNFNQLVSDAILKSFNANVISDVYDLNFEHLNINIITGEIKIRNVVIAPKDIALRDYPYINSSFVLKTERINLKRVDIYMLLKYSQLKVSKIEIDKPGISVALKGKNPILFPIKQGEIADESDGELLKKYLDSYFLKEFVLREASLTMEDEHEGKRYKIGALNIFISDIQLSQRTGVDSLSFRTGDLGLRDFVIHSKTGGFKFVESKNYELNIDAFAIQIRPDTIDYQVENLKTKIQDWALVTSDSVYLVGAKLVELSRKEKSLHISNLTMKPTVSHDAFNQVYKYQKELFSISVKKIDLLNISFDSLKFYKTLLIGQVNLDSADVLIYKDKTKPEDLKRFPEFPGQQLNSINFPLTIKELKISGSAIEYREKKIDGELASVKIGSVNVNAQNISNQLPDSRLSVKLDGFLENKVPFDLSLQISYKVPEFRFVGTLKQFDLADLNRVTEAFAATTIRKGVVDEIAVSGNGYKGSASGEMKFLYHDLDLTIGEKKFSKFKSGLISFAANNYLNSSNPTSPGKAAREVKFNIKRDQHKGFMNLVVKSMIAGLQQTMLPSKENRRLNRDSKKALKKEQKEQEQAIPR